MKIEDWVVGGRDRVVGFSHRCGIMKRGWDGHAGRNRLMPVGFWLLSCLGLRVSKRECTMLGIEGIWLTEKGGGNVGDGGLTWGVARGVWLGGIFVAGIFVFVSAFGFAGVFCDAALGKERTFGGGEFVVLRVGRGSVFGVAGGVGDFQLRDGIGDWAG